VAGSCPSRFMLRAIGGGGVAASGGGRGCRPYSGASGGCFGWRVLAHMVLVVGGGFVHCDLPCKQVGERGRGVEGGGGGSVGF